MIYIEEDSSLVKTAARLFGPSLAFTKISIGKEGTQCSEPSSMLQDSQQQIK